MTVFGELDPVTGVLTNMREISHTDLIACPHFILSPEHYRSNGTCRCDDRTHEEMLDWGYTWDGERWVG